MVQLLIDNGLNLNSKDDAGYSLLYRIICAFSGNSDKLYHEFIFIFQTAQN